MRCARGQAALHKANRATPAALGAGLTEAVVVVTPMEVVKIRMQSGAVVDGQLKYRNVAQTIGQIVRESGVRGLYSGFALTALRQATNQAGLFASPAAVLMHNL